jgi:hypothetical protein
MILVMLTLAGRDSAAADPGIAARTNVTYSRDVAPILNRQCVVCHRSGQSAPFALTRYEEVRKHAQDIGTVTASRYMPPWLPEKGYGKLANERRLTEEEIDRIQRWIEAGAPEGNPTDLPPAPQFPDGWVLGPPDLIVDLPEYTLSAEGKDVYRNLVAPIPLKERRYVRAVEFQPGNPRVVHHAYVQIDETRQSRRRAEREKPAGFDGMDGPESAVMPGGQLLGWQPGKIPSESPYGLAWGLRPGTDLVLQMHLNPSGKPETVRPRVGFYFTEQRPTNSPFRLRLTVLALDIPPGVSNYVAEESYTLPIDAYFVRVGSHAHYLGKEMRGTATLPDGRREELFWIRDWDFKWQGDYAYETPMLFPKGTRIAMRFTYDNTTNNVRNPNHPPRRVKFGPESKDEMGSLYFQIVPKTPSDYPILSRDYAQYFLGVSLESFRWRIRDNPQDAKAHKRLGRALGYSGKIAEGLAELAESLRLDPTDGETYFDIGILNLQSEKISEAYEAFQKATRLNPHDSDAFGSLGICAGQLGKLEEARVAFQTAVQLNPDDTRARHYLTEVERLLQSPAK